MSESGPVSTPEAPGRELDALVAMKVMGIDPALIHTEEGGKVVDWKSFTQVRVAAVAHYSTDIRAAWDVVVRMERRAWDCRLDLTNDGARAQFVDGDAQLCGAASVDPREGTMALAICKAALSALAVEQPTP